MIKKRNWIIVILLLCFIGSYAQSDPDILLREIYVSNQETNALEILQLIKKANIKLAYSSNDTDLDREVLLNKNKYTVKELLGLIIADSDLRIVERKGKILLTSQPIHSSNKNTISGFVKDADSNEVLIGATIYIPGTGKGVVTNFFGFYSLSLPNDNYELETSFVGFKKQKIKADLTSGDLKHNFYLNADYQLDPVTLISDYDTKKLHNKSNKRITKEEIDNVPVLLGESDPLKVLKLAAGVSGGVGSSTLLNVRGGNSDENLVLLDGIPVYNYNHLSGIVSIFNTHAIKHVDFYKGQFPAQYNGRLSSVIDVRTKDGHMKAYHGNLSLSPLTFSGSLEGPIQKNKSSFVSNFRRSSVDLINNLGSEGLGYYFYDYNFKANYLFGNSDRIYLSVYIGKDNLKVKKSELFDNLRLNWGNQLVSFKWNHVYNARVFQHSSLTYSNFENNFLGNLFENGSSEDESNINSKLGNQIRDFSLNTEIEYYASEKIKTNFGVNLKFLRFDQSYSRFKLSEVLASNQERNKSMNFDVYIENRIKINNKFLVKTGVNMTNYFLSSKVYNYFLPRLSIYYTPGTKNTFFGSFSSVSQFNHEITSGSYSLPNELRAPSTKKIPPKRSTTFEIGYNYDFNKKDKLSVQAYYKEIEGVLIYRPGQNIFNNNLALNWEDRIVYGKGTRKGVELEITKHLGEKVKLTTSYTLSKADNRFDNINQGNPFPSAFDYRHVSSTSVNMNFIKNISITSVFNYSTGKRIGIPIYSYTDFDTAIDVNNSNESLTLLAPSPNSHQLSDNYSFDIGATYKKKYKNNHVLNLGAGIYNLFSNAPPLLSYATLSENNDKIELIQIKLAKIIPYLSISYKF
ncbi:outer membrane receptor for ferrienterochelin and colicin [Aquimarina sp. MAR_2010_214]|uniref:TonB-dependent receptor n=1 Tax=Aquimarina sp. MAR_2010_214 TaxID=1250026 RepID=UPI000C709A7B|nr:TonB-dependent receptor [Aquimarina sp. MAR_2010_214]PKV50267.1 outer membrane receptor for ferrienterochelin and colicin [Aquimarina sp. MAR_2010_214]